LADLGLSDAVLPPLGQRMVDVAKDIQAFF
jgi:hypothetical protein